MALVLLGQMRERERLLTGDLFGGVLCFCVRCLCACVCVCMPVLMCAHLFVCVTGCLPVCLYEYVSLCICVCWKTAVLFIVKQTGYLMIYSTIWIYTVGFLMKPTSVLVLICSVLVCDSVLLSCAGFRACWTLLDPGLPDEHASPAPPTSVEGNDFTCSAKNYLCIKSKSK